MIKPAFCPSVLALVLVSCAPQAELEAYTQTAGTESEAATEATTEATLDSAADSVGATVSAVEVSGDAASGYTFAVTVESPDEGCDQYANWWEVISEDETEETLLYRRILAHSHVDEQPFARSGGPVMIEADDRVVVRSHMHPTGYSTQAMKGSVDEGFESTSLPPEYASELATAEPLPTGCGF